MWQETKAELKTTNNKKYTNAMQKIINIKEGVTRMPEWRMAKPVNFQAEDGEHIAIVGPNGGGKSMFVDIIVGRHPLLRSKSNPLSKMFFPSRPYSMVATTTAHTICSNDGISKR